jgi:hypothetical protein
LSASVVAQNAVQATSGTLTVNTVGDLILVVVYRNGSGTQYPLSLSGPVSSWTSAIGTLGTAGEEIDPGAYYMSAYYGYATATGGQTISVTFNGTAPGTVFLFMAECTDIASANAVIATIGHQQSSLAPGTNVITVSGGTGSNNVVTQPALVVMVAETTAGSITASSGFTQNYSSAAKFIESQRITTTGTFNSTATLNTSTGTVNSFQIALAEAGATGYSIGEILQGSFSGGSGSQAMTTVCNVGDLYVVMTELENVSGLVNAGITDTVNGTYSSVASFYPGSGNTCINILYVACTQSGTPTLQWANTGTYSNAIYQIVRVTGFPSSPVLDTASIKQATGTGTAISNSTTLADPNELAISANFYGQPITFGSQSVGWTDTGVGAAGQLRNEYYQGGASGALSFSATASTSGTWYNYLFGFYSGVTIVGSQGAFTMTGENATFTVSSASILNPVLLANPAAFDWVGAQSQSQLISQNAYGPFFWNGQVANLTSSTGAAFTLSAAFGSFAMTGENATLQGYQYIMPEFTGYFAMTGVAANLISGTQVVVPPGYEVLPNLVGLDWLTASAVLWYGGYAEISPQIVKGSAIQMQEGLVTGQTPSAFTVVPNGCAVQLSVASSNLLSVSFESH